MKELSLHILDLIENGITAGADYIRFYVDERVYDNVIAIEIEDNGRGIAPDMLEKITDPFVTTRATRRVGMGLSLFRAAAERCGGIFEIKSETGKGTVTRGEFQYDHIDRAPLGDMPSTIISLLAGYPEIDINYTHLYDDNKFVFDTREIREELEGVPLNEPAVLQYLKKAIQQELDGIRHF